MEIFQELAKGLDRDDHTDFAVWKAEECLQKLKGAVSSEAGEVAQEFSVVYRAISKVLDLSCKFIERLGRRLRRLLTLYRFPLYGHSARILLLPISARYKRREHASIEETGSVGSLGRLGLGNRSS